MGSLPAQWKASIPFLCSVTYDNTSFTDIPPSVPLSLIDISDYLGGHKYPARRLSFCPTTYPPPTSDEEMTSRKSPGWCDLSRALGTAAHEAGNPIILNGSQKSSNLQHCNRVFWCASFHRTSRTTAVHDHTDPDQFRNTSLQNDRRNNRIDGLLRAKRIKLGDRRGVCTCKFQLWWNGT